MNHNKVAGGRTALSTRAGALCVLTIAMTSCGMLAAPEPAQPMFDRDREGHIAFKAEPTGDRIPDFSNVGYMGGGVRIPDVPTSETIKPGEGDDGERIQKAIDRVAKMPLHDDGFRGAVVLKKGEYRIRGAILISASGIVLRGEGDDIGGTTLIATGSGRRTLITISGDAQESDVDLENEAINEPPNRPRDAEPREITSTRQEIIDAYVPVGARTFRVANAHDFKVGDNIIVHRPSTTEWIHVLGMDQLPPREDSARVVQWRPGAYDLRFDRIITDIDGDRITIHAPLTNSLDRKYGGGFVYRYEFPQRINKVGVENLRAISKAADPTDESHSWSLIRMDCLRDGWVRNVRAEHFARSLVVLDRWAENVTVQDCANIDPYSRIEGSRRYSFGIIGQLNLIQRCTARNGRHDFVMHEGRVAGPNVFFNCTAEKAHADSGPHGRWCTGTLYDNVKISGDNLNAMNHGNEGSGHGWAGAAIVLWNCSADKIKVENPPTAQNWAIGCKADEHKGDGLWDSFGRKVEPRSLYLAQLQERLGAKAVATVGMKGPFAKPKEWESPGSN